MFRSNLSSIFILLILIGCGGGGGGGGGGSISGGVDSAPVYSGKTDTVVVEGSNAKELVAYHFFGNDILESVAAFNPEYWYRSQFLTENLIRSDLDSARADEPCVDGGSLSRDGELDSRSLGEVTLNLNNCTNGAQRMNGTILFRGRDQGTQRVFELRFTALRMENANSKQTAVSIDGHLIMPRPINGSVQDGEEIMRGDLLIRLPDLAREVQLANISKKYIEGNDYIFQSSISVSHLGQAVFGLNTVTGEAKIEASGAIVSHLQRDNVGRVLAHDVTMSSDLTGSATQLKTLALSEIDTYFTDTGSVANIMADTVQSVSQGQDVVLNLAVSDKENDFYSFDWQVKEFDGDCDLINPHAQGSRFVYRADCAGNIRLTVQADDGKQRSNSLTITQRVLQNSADFLYKSLPIEVSNGDRLSGSPTVTNSDQGPFIFSLAYGMNGATVDSDGRFDWSSDDLLTMLGQTSKLYYGIQASNDRDTVVEVVLNYTNNNFQPTKVLDNKPFQGFYYGGVDLDTTDSNANIAYMYARIDGSLQVAKLNKGTQTLAIIPSNLPPKSGLATSNGRDLFFRDFTGDGVADAAYLLKNAINFPGTSFVSHYELELLVYDFVAESIASQTVVMTFETSSRSHDFKDVSAIDIDGDQTAEIVFYVQGSVSLRENSQKLIDTVMVYNSVTGKTSRVADLLASDGTENFRRAARILTLPASSSQPARIAVLINQWLRVFQYQANGFVEAFRQKLPNLQYSATGSEPIADLLHYDVDDDGQQEFIVVAEDERRDCFFEERRNNAYVAVLSENLNIEVEHNLSLNFASASYGVYGENDKRVLLQLFDCNDRAVENIGFAHFDVVTGKLLWRSSLEPTTLTRFAGMVTPNGVMSYLASDGKRHFVVADAGLRISQ